MKTSQALKSTGTRIVEQVPFVGGLIGGGRLPISNALPDVGQLFKLTDNEVDSKKKFEIATKEIAKPLTYLVLPLGGGQIKKVVEGIGTVAKGGSYTYNNDGEKELQFPVFNKGIGEYAQGTLFGKYALPEAQKYIESGFKWLSAKQTKAYDLLVDGGEAAKKSFETIGKIKSVKGAEEKRNLLLDLPIKPNQKSLLDDWLIGERKNKIDYTDDDTFVLSQLTDSMQAKYKKAMSKLDVDAKTISDIMESINDIRADKDKYGKSISGSAKEKKIKTFMKAGGLARFRAEELYDIIC